jgi:hypothetical protein
MQENFKPSPKAFKNTFCVFQEVPLDAIMGLRIQYESKSGSQYYYTKAGMFRYSNHWGRLANSKWRLIPLVPDTDSKFKIGFANWDQFYPDSSKDKCYYIAVNYTNKTVTYEHYRNPNYDAKAIVRTSFETTKRIKQIRNLLTLTSWSKYFEYVDLEELRKKIITELIFSDKTLEQIKRELL